MSELGMEVEANTMVICLSLINGRAKFLFFCCAFFLFFYHISVLAAHRARPWKRRKLWIIRFNRRASEERKPRDGVCSRPFCWSDRWSSLPLSPLSAPDQPINVMGRRTFPWCPSFWFGFREVHEQRRSSLTIVLICCTNWSISFTINSSVQKQEYTGTRTS